MSKFKKLRNVEIRKLPMWYILPDYAFKNIPHIPPPGIPNIPKVPKQEPNYKGFYEFTTKYCNVETNCDRCFLDKVKNVIPERFCSGYDTCSKALAEYAEKKFIKRTIE